MQTPQTSHELTHEDLQDPSLPSNLATIDLTPIAHLDPTLQKIIVAVHNNLSGRAENMILVSLEPGKDIGGEFSVTDGILKMIKMGYTGDRLIQLLKKVLDHPWEHTAFDSFFTEFEELYDFFDGHPETFLEWAMQYALSGFEYFFVHDIADGHIPKEHGELVFRKMGELLYTVQDDLCRESCFYECEREALYDYARWPQMFEGKIDEMIAIYENAASVTEADFRLYVRLNLTATASDSFQEKVDEIANGFQDEEKKKRMYDVATCGLDAWLREESSRGVIRIGELIDLCRKIVELEIMDDYSVWIIMRDKPEALIDLLYGAGLLNGSGKFGEKLLEFMALQDEINNIHKEMVRIMVRDSVTDGVGRGLRERIEVAKEMAHRFPDIFAKFYDLFQLEKLLPLVELTAGTKTGTSRFAPVVALAQRDGLLLLDGPNAGALTTIVGQRNALEQCLADDIAASNTDKVISEADEMITRAYEESKMLMPVGSKLHIEGRISGKVMEVLAGLGIYSTGFQSAHAQQAIVLPPTPTSFEQKAIVQLLRSSGLMGNHHIQITASGEWPNELCGIVCATTLLATQVGQIFEEGAFSTNQIEQAASRMMLRGAGIRQYGLSYDIADKSPGRTDKLGSADIGDIDIYQFMATMAAHAHLNGALKPLMEMYTEEFRFILAKHGLLDALTIGTWVSDRDEDSRASIEDLKLHEEMIGEFCRAWFEAQEKEDGGVHREIRALLARVYQTFQIMRHTLTSIPPLLPAEVAA